MPSNAYNLERAKRRPLTKKNLRELNIDQTWRSILDHPDLVYVDDYGVRHKPVGFSLNKSSFGNFSGSAYQRGWLAYMNLGEPLIEERRNINQPPPDTFSSRAYVNLSQTSTMNFTDSVDFTVSNGITWSLQGSSQLTFGGSVGAELQLQLAAQLQLQLQAQFQTQLQNQLQNTMDNKVKNSVTNKNSKDNIGVDNDNTTENGVTNSTTNGVTNSAATSVTTSGAFTTTGTATGKADLSAQLALGLTASVSGTLTTSWASKSEISGTVQPGSRVETLVTQRRAVKQYTYEIPVTFSGLLAVKYDVPVAVLSPPQPGEYPGLDEVVARDIADLGLAGGGFRMKGLAEVVSALEVHHTMFDGESLTGSERELHKQP
ncbi:hypothetical protein [Streptomyces clavuligerus]|nr:hypothetical protein [Streptomyces clavuligerus]EDY49670.1 conserved hypothetical protein [Streptomyces clavuligerus]MBY6307422.1 hypothetical protein [Streptomyces clavuligerus]QCS10018.1 hypothetical protein CRV15_31035 [Streptomyces clavuligerus]QPJ97937.1 hypothetical protein GE265_33410 [Streptomyces clavuligerus]WDN56724.1 hypothetical protein LL058_33465 [Streptomyces clavuligerus]